MDLRSKKVIFLSHCILNQNSVVNTLARAKGAYAEIIDLIMDQGIGIYQMPCPEMIQLGMKRKPMTKEDYDTLNYRTLCKNLAEDTIKSMQNYLVADYKLMGIIGINESPTCSIKGKVGIFMEELQKEMKSRGISLKMMDVSSSYVEGSNNSKDLGEIKNFLTLEV